MTRMGVAEQTRHYRERVEEVARSLLDETAQPSQRSPRAALVVLIGVPGSGKSHFGRLVAARLAATIVATDVLRRRLFVAPSYRPEETRVVFRVAHAMTRALLADAHAVVFDATNLRERDRRPLYRIADAAKVPLVLARVTASDETAYARLARRRSRAMPDDASEADERVYEMMRGRYEEPSRAHLIVDSTADLDEAVARVAEAIG